MSRNAREELQNNKWDELNRIRMALNKKLFRFSLRAFVLLLTIFCIWLGKLSIDAKRQKEGVAWVLKNGGTVSYDWETEAMRKRVPAVQPRPRWLVNIVGDDFFQTVTKVDLTGASVSDISTLASFPRVEMLSLPRNKIRDLQPLDRLSWLNSLGLYQNDVEDLSPLTGLPRLKRLVIGENRIRDITLLKDLPALEVVAINGNDIDDFTPLLDVPNLKKLIVDESGSLKVESMFLKKARPELNVTVLGTSDPFK